MSKMTQCKTCSKEIASSAKTCPGCGANNKKPFYKRGWFISIVIVLILCSIGGVCSKKYNEKVFFKEMDEYVEGLTKLGGGHFEYSMPADGLIALVQDMSMPGYNTNYEMSKSSLYGGNKILNGFSILAKGYTDKIYEIAENCNYDIKHVGILNYINGIKVLESTDGYITWSYGD